MPALVTPFHWLVVIVSVRHTSSSGTLPAPAEYTIVGSMKTGTPHASGGRRALAHGPGLELPQRADALNLFGRQERVRVEHQLAERAPVRRALGDQGPHRDVGAVAVRRLRG